MVKNTKSPLSKDPKGLIIIIWPMKSVGSVYFIREWRRMMALEQQITSSVV